MHFEMAVNSYGVANVLAYWLPHNLKSTKRHQIDHSKADADGVILGVRVRRPSWTPCWITPFCPTSGMSTQVF